MASKIGDRIIVNKILYFGNLRFTYFGASGAPERLLLQPDFERQTLNWLQIALCSFYLNFTNMRVHS